MERIDSKPLGDKNVSQRVEKDILKMIRVLWHFVTATCDLSEYITSDSTQIF